MASFPTFTNGVISGLPYGEGDRFNTTQSYMPCGVTFTHAWNPTQKQRGFLVQFNMMTKAEMQTLEDFWVEMDGRSGQFSFTDDKAVVHTDCHFDQEELEFQYIEAGHYAIAVKVLALN